MSVPFHEPKTFPIATEARYLLHVPREGCDLAIVALHGYGMTPEDMLRLTAMSLDGNQVVASLQAPNQHYGAEGPGAGKAAYNWGIRQHHPQSVRLHHEIVLRVIEDIGSRFGIPPRRCVLLGFSQPVGLNYRFIGTHPEAAGGVIGICGGVPKDWEEPDRYKSVAAPLLHIARADDEFFPAAVANEFPARLRAHAANVEYHLLPGAHRYPSGARKIVLEWLDRLSAA